MFWKIRDILDKLGLSYYKEGHVDGVLVDMETGRALSPGDSKALFRSCLCQEALASVESSE